MAASTTEEMAVESGQARSFAREHFGAVDLGHKARNACLLRVAEQICRHPGGTLPTKLANPADYDAMDRLMNRPETTHERVLAAHRQRTRAKMDASTAAVLVLHDLTTLDYSGLTSIQELGQVGNGGGRGYLCYNALAVDPERREVIGLAHQLLHRRAKVPPREGVKAKRLRRHRESRLWSTAVQELGTPPPDAHVTDVADRGADVYEFLATERQLGRTCLVRACYNRVVVTTTATGALRTKLFDYLRGLPAQGEHQQTIGDSKTRQERSARLRLAWAEVWLQPPHVRRGEYENQPIRVWGVRVWEVDAPSGATPVEWMLLSSAAVSSIEAARQKVQWYACRYMVEEYHKGMKTGCQIEDLQFRSAQALQPMIALLSVVAVLLLNLRLACRQPDADQRLATELVEPIYEETLRSWRYKQPRGEMTVQEYYLAMARLGGHMNRKSDGPPGWLVLWRGWMKLHLMVTGVEGERRRRRRIRGET